VSLLWAKGEAKVRSFRPFRSARALANAGPPANITITILLAFNHTIAIHYSCNQRVNRITGTLVRLVEGKR